MMKKTVALLLLLMSFLPGRAQKSSSYRLSLDDFSIRDTTVLEPSYLRILWNRADKDQRVGRTRYRYTEYHAIVDKAFSWIRVDQDVDKQLAVNQTLYEIAESLARAETDSLLFLSLNGKQVDKRLNHAYLISRNDYLETGNLSFPVSFDREFDIASIPWEPRQKGGSLSFSMGETVLLGATPGLSSPITSVSAEVEYFRRHSAILLNASYGLGRYSGRYNNLAGLLRNGELIPYWTVSGQYAYQIPCLHRGKLSAFAGVGYSNLGLVDNKATDRNSKIQGVAFSEGLALDWYARSNTLDFRGPRHDLVQKGFRIKLFASQILTLPQNTIVPTLNLGFGYMFSTQSVKPRS